MNVLLLCMFVYHMHAWWSVRAAGKELKMIVTPQSYLSHPFCDLFVANYLTLYILVCSLLKCQWLTFIYIVLPSHQSLSKKLPEASQQCLK